MKRLLLLIPLCALSACQATHMSQQSVSVSPTLQANLCADIAVGGPIEGTESAGTLFKIFTFGPEAFVDGVQFGAGNSFVPDPDSKLKSAAAYQAVAKGGVDVIVDPRYTIKNTDYFIYKSTVAHVQGKSGRIRSISSGGDCNASRVVANARSEVSAGESAGAATNHEFVLQIASVGNERSARAMVTANPGVSDLSVYRTLRNGKPWFIVAQGRYPTVQSAKAAIANLPATLRQNQPFPRSSAGIELFH